MSLLRIHEMYLKNLEGTISQEHTRSYLPKEEALEELRQITGLDFGYDVKKWSDWIDSNLDRFNELHSKFINQ
jgi:hypothetical protein